jgi:hypothetical protein
MRINKWVLSFLLMAFCVAGAQAVENKGAENISLDAGEPGVVLFPHHRHQNALQDCKICHELFPQEKGSILKLKNEGQLAKKQIMNKLCIKCHRAEKQAGKPGGPTTCTQCHVRK